MIGIFDSGIGGLTVVKKIFEYLKQYSVLYIGDTARAPYGDRGKEVITQYAFQATDFLLQRGAKIIVVACNTISAIAVDDLEKKYNVPIFEVVNPGVRAALKHTKNKRIGVIGTRATINSKIYEKLLHKADKKIKVITSPAPLLVPLVEENWLKKPETKMIVKQYVRPLRLKQIDTLILACTHYPFLRHLISMKIGKNVSIIDPGEEVAKQVKEYIDSHKDIEKTFKKGDNHQFFVSDKTEKFQSAANLWLGQKINLKKVNMYYSLR